MTQTSNIITADEGKIFRRIADNTLYGKEITLGYTYYIGGLLLTTPHKDEASDFEEIDEPTDYTDEEEIVTTTILSELEIAKLTKKKAIHLYDTSLAVNEFFYKGISCWLDKATRVGLVNSTTMEKQAGRTTTKLILGDLSFELGCDDVLSMLAQLEVYAKDCYDTTAQHLINVNSLTSVSDVENYDYTTSYPSKISFS